MSTIYVCAHKGPKTKSDLLELALQTVGNHPNWVPGTKFGSSGRATATLLTAELSLQLLSQTAQGLFPSKVTSSGDGSEEMEREL